MSITEISNEENISFCFCKDKDDETLSLQNDCSNPPFILFNPNSEIVSRLPMDEEKYKMPYELNINNYYITPINLSFYKPLLEDISQKKVSLFSCLEKEEHI